MQTLRPFFLLCVSFLAASPARSAHVAQAALQDTEIAVRVGEAAAPPDAQVVVPLSITADGDVKVGTVSVRLPFPKEELTFVKTDPSGLAAGVDAKVTSEEKPGSNARMSVLHVTISTTDAGGSRKPLPVGVLGYITFRISKQAKPETAIALTPEATLLTTDDPPKPLTPAKPVTAEVTVSSPPVPVCFFYMH